MLFERSSYTCEALLSGACIWHDFASMALAADRLLPLFELACSLYRCTSPRANALQKIRGNDRVRVAGPRDIANRVAQTIFYNVAAPIRHHKTICRSRAARHRSF